MSISRTAATYTLEKRHPGSSWPLCMPGGSGTCSMQEWVEIRRELSRLYLHLTPSQALHMRRDSPPACDICVLFARSMLSLSPIVTFLVVLRHIPPLLFVS